MALLADAALDLAIGYVITNGTHLALCSSEPANYAGISAVRLAQDASVVPAAASDGATSGRRTVVPAQQCVASASGNATHWALHNNSAILVATGPLSATIAITSGLTYDTAAFSITLPDAVAA